MSTYLDSFKSFNQFSKQLIVFKIIMCAFWTVPFCLFKPEFFKFPIYVQIAVIFSLSTVWYLLTMISTVKYLKSITELEMSITMLTIISIFLLCASVVISYYYSNSFTFFLRVAFLYVLLPVHLFQFVLMLREHRRETRERRDNEQS